MGTAISSIEALEDNELLKRLCDAEPISDNDPLFNKLFSFNFNLEQQDKYVYSLKNVFRIVYSLLEVYKRG